MKGNGDTTVLRWPGRLLCAEDLRRGLNGQRELIVSPDTIVTPLALDELRAHRVRLSRQETAPAPSAAAWGYAQQPVFPVVASAVQALGRDGSRFLELPVEKNAPASFARAVAECIANGQCRGGVVFSDDAGLICCVANKVPGLRAAGVICVAQAARALSTLAANLIVVEMPGRTYFEICQILRNAAARTGTCPVGVACTLRELDGHAHR